ncbi:TFIIB-type zinc ribbon-containing protein [Xanthomonas translucens]|uniref:TFIIB-type zinc ribbon-containing protein n=2 Tax=Xanthomonas campestris pv. translucens TaxID=343 RepID=UPI00129631A6|nr:TFIIB-type zinc ribbon-containing protein [Xanthomonas translucens]MCS3360152.1 TFIIB-type zinc ribbon-containing protein [Xanthomonas translucens pv. translucens]MCS3373264.1 TFIIB-type zinc ribbon-containing protein [Xanthomonas translucens pv. translucens]MCT8289681.1 TFIIB-type zinc ribbon-containing protein [Xanthomonas translucens pv. translucens]MCT8293409.1 TFIIB-type zinc ribbon-containing protein [Xanthomonas translucens pv. translucens]MCT8312323.1 TFIIB-type zinc ribbon-containi
MSDPSTPPPPPTPPPLPPRSAAPPPVPAAAVSGPGSPQEVPPLPGSFPLDPATLPAPIRDELRAPDPLAIDTAANALKDGLNRCPKCGATDIRPKLGTDLLVCQYCRNEWHGARVEEVFGFGEGLDALRGTVIASGARDIAADAAVLMSFKCSGCGAEVTVNTESTMTARCHWCRHVFGINEQVANGAVPDAVLPFHIKKEDAVARIRQFVDKRHLFALKAFKQQFTPDNVVGVYLPYMIVDGNVSASVAGTGEIETRRYTRGTEKNKTTYYDADVYQVQRHVDFTVDDLPLESSSERGNLDTQANTNNIINTILPFDTKNAVQWNASYLAGFTSEKRNRDVEQLRPRLEDQLLSIARAQVEDSVGRYDRGVRWEQERLEVHGTRWVSMYLPVWLYSYHQPGRNGGMLHYIAVNGRTGETMGSVPVQQWKLLLTALTAGTFIEAIALWILVGSS